MTLNCSIATRYIKGVCILFGLFALLHNFQSDSQEVKAENLQRSGIPRTANLPGVVYFGWCTDVTNNQQIQDDGAGVSTTLGESSANVYWPL